MVGLHFCDTAMNCHGAVTGVSLLYGWLCFFGTVSLFHYKILAVEGECTDIIGLYFQIKGFVFKPD